MKATTQGELKAKLNERYPGLDSLTDAFVESFAIHQPDPAETGLFNAMVGCFVIREDEIKLFDALTTALLAASNGMLFTFQSHEKVLAAKVAIGVAIVKLLKGFCDKGVFLKEGELKILTLVKAASPKGVTEADILKVLGEDQTEFDISSITRYLSLLGEYPTRHHGGTKLVSKNALGLWRAHV